MTSLKFVFEKNQYAVLTDPPRRIPPASMTYRVDIGNDRMTSELAPVQTNGEWTTTSTTFYGKCHNCNYSAHSQKYCPLSKCVKCDSFGHTASACDG